jgi:hypothetical protein
MNIQDYTIAPVSLCNLKIMLDVSFGGQMQNLLSYLHVDLPNSDHYDDESVPRVISEAIEQRLNLDLSESWIGNLELNEFGSCYDIPRSNFYKISTEERLCHNLDLVYEIALNRDAAKLAKSLDFVDGTSYLSIRTELLLGENLSLNNRFCEFALCSPNAPISDAQLAYLRERADLVLNNGVFIDMTEINQKPVKIRLFLHFESLSIPDATDTILEYYKLGILEPKHMAVFIDNFESANKIVIENIKSGEYSPIDYSSKLMLPRNAGFNFRKRNVDDLVSQIQAVIALKTSIIHSRCPSIDVVATAKQSIGQLYATFVYAVKAANRRFSED